MDTQYAQVWNDGDSTYTEDFKGKKIEIEPKQFIVMERQEACEFMSQFIIPKKDGAGNFVNSKPLRKVILGVTDTKGEGRGLPPGFCVVCNRDYGLKANLVKHFKEKHANLVPVEDKKDDSSSTGNTDKK